MTILTDRTITRYGRIISPANAQAALETWAQGSHHTLVAMEMIMQFYRYPALSRFQGRTVEPAYALAVAVLGRALAAGLVRRTADGWEMREVEDA